MLGPLIPSLQWPLTQKLQPQLLTSLCLRRQLHLLLPKLLWQLPGSHAAALQVPAPEQLRWRRSAAAFVLSGVSMLAHASADPAWHPADTLLSLHIGCPTSHCCMAPVFESCFMQPLHASISCVHCSQASCKADACSPWSLPYLTHCLADAGPASASKAPPKKIEQGAGSFLKAHRPPRPALRTSPPSAASGKQASPASDQVCAYHLSALVVKIIITWNLESFSDTKQ